MPFGFHLTERSIQGAGEWPNNNVRFGSFATEQAVILD